MPKHEPRQKNKGGRPKGSRTCRPEVPLKPSKRMVDLMSSCYSDDEWQRRFKQLPVVEQFRLRGGAEPKPKEASSASTFRLVIEGLAGKEPITCPQCKHEFTVAPTTHQEAPGNPISPPATPEAALSGGPKVYVPDEGALKRLREAREEELPGTWYEGPDDFDPDKET